MTSKTTDKFSPEVRARAVRMALDYEADHPSRCAGTMSIAGPAEAEERYHALLGEPAIAA